MNLEDKLLFRVIKVAYVLSTPVFFFLVLYIFYQGWHEMLIAGKQPAGEFIDWIAQKKQLNLLLGICIFIYPIYFSIVNLAKETLLYIAFGRKFTFSWIEIAGHCTA